MGKIKRFLKRKQVEISAKRYFVDAMSAMAQGLFCTLLVGTILNTLGSELNIPFLTETILTLGNGEGAVSYTIGGLASALVGPGIAIAIGLEPSIASLPKVGTMIASELVNAIPSRPASEAIFA